MKPLEEAASCKKDVDERILSMIVVLLLEDPFLWPFERPMLMSPHWKDDGVCWNLKKKLAAVDFEEAFGHLVAPWDTSRSS